MAPPKKQKVANKSQQARHNPPKQQTFTGIIGTTSTRSTQKISETQQQAAPIQLQQSILDVFCRAFHGDQRSLDDINASIQKVKGHLFLREFSHAFAKQEYLDAYALRWSASRALGYLDILLHGDLQDFWLGEITSRPDDNNNAADAHTSTDAADPPREQSDSGACRIACIGGGGGAEVAACAAAALALSTTTFDSARSGPRPLSLSLSPSSKAEIHAIDIADWSGCVEKLTTALTAPRELSAYASESAKAANKPLIDPGCLQVRFSQRDILNADEDALRGLLGGVGLCTIMFTLNELFTDSIARATAFLLALTDVMALGSWFLVVDSPGSYSEVKLGNGEDAKSKRYPMKWLLDHTLLEVAGGKNSKWRKHVSDDSRWFRLNPALKYPMDLENMRYQIHLYQRIESEGS
ncbi:hypothetical protein LTR84_002331 [Exophiala bonariae]|uniref:25S rRNA (Uridine(2843)-N(3))-methyltransferase n=1 Tax=Exophiala bonariae TaxID=1690606 RepID=A0AAV9NEX1_9EURO|nr:hypothetical protein LTR84_002331 [Exophiala bonariae]